MRLIQSFRKVNIFESLNINPKWIYRWYIIAYCFIPSLILSLIGFLSDGDALVIFGQFALALGSFSALYILRKHPLINPIQAVVFMFHYWFAIGPAVIATYAYYLKDHDLLSKYINNGGEVLWITAFGLPIYSIFSKILLRAWPKDKFYANFLMPIGFNYRVKTIICYGLVGLGIHVIIYILKIFGIEGVEVVDFLGGTKSKVWWISVLYAIGGITMFATCGLLAYLVVPNKDSHIKIKIIAILYVVIYTLYSFTLGFKGPTIGLMVIIGAFYVVWKQKIPWLGILLVVLSYYIVIEPYVSYIRYISVKSEITNTQERIDLIANEFSHVDKIKEAINREINIGSPFRGIYELAAGISSRSSIFTGPWDGTIYDGLTILLPRVIYEDKPDASIGNFIARDLEVAAPEDYMTNVGTSIPFEFLGNYGYLAGLISFGILGILWTTINAFILSPQRLATHPLTPLFILYATKIEAPFGQFLASLRDLPLILITTYIIWVVLKKQL